MYFIVIVGERSKVSRLLAFESVRISTFNFIILRYLHSWIEYSMSWYRVDSPASDVFVIHGELGSRFASYELILPKKKKDANQLFLCGFNFFLD